MMQTRKPAAVQRLKVKPANGLKIQDPQTGAFLADDGEMKPLSNFWCRRLAKGDVVVCGSERRPAAMPKPEPTQKPKA